MKVLGGNKTTPNLTAPNIHEGKKSNASHVNNDSIVYAKDEISLTKESSCLHHIHLNRQRARRQITPEITAELGLSDEQLNSLKAQVNRRFLTGYDCANPREVKPISSFVRDPCEPAKANDKDEYVMDPPTQYQIVQYKTRREFKGTGSEKNLSQFTYYCGTADHASPYPQGIYYRRPTIMLRDDCKTMASLGRYVAGDGKTYNIPPNHRMEIRYFALGSVTTYTGWEGHHISCSGGTFMVDGEEIHHTVMHVTEEILFRDEKFISREDDDRVIAHYNNVRLSCPIEDKHCVAGDVTYVWHIPLEEHCPLYHVRNFKGQIVKYETPGLTIKTLKVLMSTDHSHVQFVIKGKKIECDQPFLTTNYQDLLVRSTIVEGVLDRDLITRELPKDELKLSNFITNRDDFIYHEISRNLRREFASVLHDECQETEHYLDCQLPGYHTYRLGGPNYLTAAGEVAYFYKCRPRLVAAIRADTCYDALPVGMTSSNDTLTFFVQEDGKEALVPKYYIEPLTHRLTSVAKKVPCLSKFFARYKDIFGQWFAVTPHIATTEPPGKLDLETLHKKVRFDPSTDINLSKGGVYYPDAVDDLISWLEGNRCQEVVIHQLADQVGNLNPGQYITPRLMFPPSHHTRWFMALVHFGQIMGCY